jgi:hypothetical protein
MERCTRTRTLNGRLDLLGVTDQSLVPALAISFRIGDVLVLVPFEQRSRRRGYEKPEERLP